MLYIISFILSRIYIIVIEIQGLGLLKLECYLGIMWRQGIELGIGVIVDIC